VGRGGFQPAITVLGPLDVFPTNIESMGCENTLLERKIAGRVAGKFSFGAFEMTIHDGYANESHDSSESVYVASIVRLKAADKFHARWP
jgi:hypothetical protein